MKIPPYIHGPNYTACSSSDRWTPSGHVTPKSANDDLIDAMIAEVRIGGYPADLLPEGMDQMDFEVLIDRLVRRIAAE